MRLQVDGDEFTEHLFEEIGLLSGRAKYIYSSLTHEREARVVAFVIERQRVRQLQKRLFGMIVSGEYDSLSSVRTRFEIRNVEAVTVRDETDGEYSRLIIERGVFVSRGVGFQKD